jgi:predicted RNase H-like HicB family nuclease
VIVEVLNFSACDAMPDAPVWSVASFSRPQHFAIYLQQLPEGVWLATSDAIPGLFIEGDSEAATIAEVTQWAKELLVENAGLDPSEDVKLVFGGRPP